MYRKKSNKKARYQGIYEDRRKLVRLRLNYLTSFHMVPAQ